MHRYWSPQKLTLCICVAAARLTAQEAPRKALVMGLNGPGLFVPISGSAALRAEGSVSHFWTGGTGNWIEGLALTGVVYVNTSDAVKMYVGPRVSFTYQATSGTNAHTQVLGGSLYFGAEHSLSSRFGVFGESGLTYARQSGNRLGQDNAAFPLPPSNTVSTFNGLGILLRF